MKEKKRWFVATLLVVLIGGCDGGTAAPSVDIEATVDQTNGSEEHSRTVSISSFIDGALAEEITTEDCTLSDGTETTCNKITIVGYPSDNEIGPFCPATTSTSADDAGIWIDGDALYDIDGDFIVRLSEIYNDDNWKLYNDDGTVNITDTKEAFELAARPDVDPSYQNYCVEGRIEWLDNGEPVETTVLIPISPVNTDSISQKFRHVGVTLNGVIIERSAPVSAILGAYTIAAFDDCGGHINPVAGYHFHAATGCSEVGDVTSGETKAFALALDGYMIHSPYEDGEEPSNLDECNGHTTDNLGYHYHANQAKDNAVLSCLVGAVEQSNESNDGPPGGGPPLMSPVQVIPSNQVVENNDNYNTNVPEYMKDVWLCTGSDIKTVDDLTTSDVEDYRCFMTVEYTEQFAIVRSNGIPNHDYESGLGCCAAEVDYEWRIPLKPELASSVTYAPERGAVAISVNGVPFFGPEEGPGGDAVALHFEYFVEDRQPIVLGLCGAHSAGTRFHYHFDGNCVHWHPEEEEKEWKDWDVDFLRKDEASPVIGFAFDGYPIYGPYGNDSNNQVKEMTSSYRLKEGKNGYGGIDDWEYVKGLGDLDECNGIISGVPGLDEALYHYHASKTSGSGEIGFPYFLLCYGGLPETSNMNQGGQGPGQGRQAPSPGMQNGVPGGNNLPPPPMGKPDCLPPNPPPGRDNYPPDWSDLSPCP